ncbi:MAG: hypothetical protein WC966_10975 [Bradymonadales bacterium]|jgi:uncharacterized Zn finger protein (UPF0148 family)
MAAHAKVNTNTPIERDEFEDENILDDYFSDESLDIALDDIDYFDTWCPECACIKPHASAKDGSHRIICAVCNNKHMRADEPSINVIPVTRSPIQAEELESPETLRAAWERLTQNAQAEQILEYSINRRFKVADLIQHRKFGLGIVCETLDDCKVNVLFQERMRKLATGRS